MKRKFLSRCVPLACVTLLAAAAVSGCGQRGPLTLPVRPADIPAPIAATKSPASANEAASATVPTPR